MGDCLYRRARWMPLAACVESAKLVGPALPSASFPSNWFGTTMISLTGGNRSTLTLGVDTHHLMSRPGC